ncbi:uncharacterized protein MONBRDRAFT_24621 [Monosiga brevicollis MX1]|uniref:Uncharacterized protein n=1 Tax=Monosiga brevicollis TaxID=81824 RepID=A9UWZ6_MONBE|nr:uncharacterized protein MONBRDRAFT_24621 [Monosiga brevicollis MX1]EDQ90127.1 predicted protein [Monosiga brevicollis MX1]|eukprot:XP_001744894.1 hypothetical protein [Monosiga brevicollis MX1]
MDALARLQALIRDVDATSLPVMMAASPPLASPTSSPTPPLTEADNPIHSATMNTAAQTDVSLDLSPIAAPPRSRWTSHQSDGATTSAASRTQSTSSQPPIKRVRRLPNSQPVQLSSPDQQREATHSMRPAIRQPCNNPCTPPTHRKLSIDRFETSSPEDSGLELSMTIHAPASRRSGHRSMRRSRARSLPTDLQLSPVRHTNTSTPPTINESLLALRKRIASAEEQELATSTPIKHIALTRRPVSPTPAHLASPHIRQAYQSYCQVVREQGLEPLPLSDYCGPPGTIDFIVDTDGHASDERSEP